MNKLIAIASIIVLGSSSAAQGEAIDTLSQPILSSYAIEIGRESVLSTYLTPIRNAGTQIALSGEWSKRLPDDPKHLSMQFTADIHGATMTPHRLTSRMYDAGISFDWRLFYTWHPATTWSVSAGAGPGLAAGALYRPANSNNPVAAYADLHIAVAARGAWATTLGRLPIVVSDEVSLPSLSLFFSPEYAEPYYAIWLGYRHGLLNAGWWGNHFDIDNMLRVRLVTGKKAIDLGYRFKVASSWVHHINTQRVSHSFVIGLTLGAPRAKIVKETLLSDI